MKLHSPAKIHQTLYSSKYTPTIKLLLFIEPNKRQSTGRLIFQRLYSQVYTYGGKRKKEPKENRRQTDERRNLARGNCKQRARACASIYELPAYIIYSRYLVLWLSAVSARAFYLFEGARSAHRFSLAAAVAPLMILCITRARGATAR